MPSDFAEEKETCFDYKKTEFFKVQKIPFSKNKRRNNVSDFAEKKETFCALNNRIFQSPKNDIFFKGVDPCFWPKNANFFFI